MKKLIIIPTYNERENISKIITAIYALAIEALEILVVDDSSPDGTAELVSTQFVDNPNYPSTHLIVRPEKEGLGKAYIAGFQWALARNYDLIIQMDADFSHHPKYLPSLLAPIDEGADLVIGSRYVNGGGTKNWNWFRKFISRGGSLYARTILGLAINDLTGGFKCFRKEVLHNIPLNKIHSAGYSFQIEMTYRTRLLGYNIQETPIVFEDRQLGNSKMSKKIILEGLYIVWKLRFKHKSLLQKQS